MLEELIPIVLFAVTALIVYLIVYFRFRVRREMHLTVRDALEKGIELPEAMLTTLNDARSSRETDLRRGIIGIAIAAAFFGFAMVLGVADAVRPLMATAMFPLLVGLAYLGIWRFGHSDN